MNTYRSSSADKSTLGVVSTDSRQIKAAAIQSNTQTANDPIPDLLLNFPDLDVYCSEVVADDGRAPDER